MKGARSTFSCSTLTFLADSPAVSHAKAPRAPRRYDKAHGFSDGILAPFILSVTKKRTTSCRRHEACLLNFLPLDSRLSGGAARPLRCKKAITIVRRTTPDRRIMRLSPRRAKPWRICRRDRALQHWWLKFRQSGDTVDCAGRKPPGHEEQMPQAPDPAPAAGISR